MSQQDPEPPAERFHRDRREHGGSADRVDDDQLARLTEEERVEAGVDAFDPDEVPPATDAPQKFDVRETGEFQEARAEESATSTTRTSSWSKVSASSSRPPTTTGSKAR